MLGEGTDQVSKPLGQLVLDTDYETERRALNSGFDGRNSNKEEVTIMRNIEGTGSKADAQTIRVAIYARESGDWQVEAWSLDAQVAEGTEFAGRYAEYTVVEIYAEQQGHPASVLGEADSRPEYRRMMSDAKAGKFNLLITTSVDRLSRNVSSLLETVEKLREYGVGYKSIHEGLDLTGPMGAMMLTMLGAFAQLESSYHIDRGLVEAKEGGLNRDDLLVTGAAAIDDPNADAQTIRVAIYARESGGLQVGAWSLDSQVAEGTEFAGRYTEYTVVEIYAEQGHPAWVRGVSDSRPEYRRMMSDAKAGKFNLLITTSVDRLSRNVSSLLETVEKLREYGVGYKSIHEGLDLTGPMEEVTLTLLADITQRVSAWRSDRATPALEQRVRNGLPIGRPPYGYQTCDESCEGAEGKGG